MDTIYAKLKRPDICFGAWFALALTVILLNGCGPGNRPPESKAVIGRPAPHFALTDIQGKKWDLAELRGKVVFLNFWATWCPPCIEEMPSMEALNRRMPTTTFQMLTILYNDRPEYARNLISKIGATFPVLVETEARTASKYGLTGVPETFVIDPQGILREKFIGPKDWNSPFAAAMLAQYLPGASARARQPESGPPQLDKSH